MILKFAKGTELSHWGSLFPGPSIFTSGGTRSARPLIFAHNVVSPQYCGGVSARATALNMLPGVLQPLRIASRARHSRRPKPVMLSGCSASHRAAAAGIQGKAGAFIFDSSDSKAISRVANALSASAANSNCLSETGRRMP